MNEDSNHEGALLHALLLDGNGGARGLSEPEISVWQPEQGVLWRHFDCSLPEKRQCFDSDSRVTPDLDST